MIDEVGHGMARVKRIANSLKKARERLEPEFETLAQHFLPRRGLFSSDPVSLAEARRGEQNLNRKLLSSTPVRALRILQSGMQSGITSPARPWFKLQPLDRDLRERQAVKEFLSKLEHECRRLAERSGLYNMLHTGYGDLGVYGTEAGIIEDEEGRRGLRTHQLMPGTYWIGSTGTEYVDVLYRETAMTINQLVGKFVYKGQRYNDPDWSVVPQRIKSLYDKGDVSETEPVSQLIMPRRDRDPRRLDGANKPIGSEYWLTRDDRAEGQQKMLRVSGYNRNPISSSRWSLYGVDVWGYGPAIDALADVKELMAKRREYAELLKRINRPTMNAHAELRNSRFSLLPGAVNFMPDPTKGLTPTFDFQPRLGELSEDIRMTESSVWSLMYADLFMMISQLDRRQITATEIDERREEKLIALGPVLELQHFEKLTPIVERLVERVMELRLAGDPPEELRGQELEIDFISMLAQAMKAVATGGIERVAGYVGNLVAVSPEAIDKLDVDQSIDEYADMIGVPPSIIRSDDAVEALRLERREAEAQAQQMQMAAQGMQMAAQGAQAAKVLAEADQPRGGAPQDILRKAGLA